MSQFENLQSKRANTSVENRQKILYEIHYKVPRTLEPPAMISHFTQAGESLEDGIYYNSIEWVKKEFSKDSVGGVKFFDNFNSAAINLEMQKNIAVHRHIVNRIYDSYLLTLKNNPALFVFGAFEHIKMSISRNIDLRKLDNDGIRGSDVYAVNSITFDTEIVQQYDLEKIYESVISVFFNVFKEFFYETLERFTVDLNELSGKTSNEVATHYHHYFRNFVLWFQSVHNGTSSEKLTSLYDDFGHLTCQEVSSDEQRDVNSFLRHELRWARYPQVWNFTLLESTKDREISRNNVDFMTEFLLTAAIEPDVMSSSRFHKSPDYIRLPGKSLAGAHYCLLSMSTILGFSLVPVESLKLGTEAELVERVRKFRRIGKTEIEKKEYIERAAKFIKLANDSKMSASRRAFIIKLVDECFQLLGKNEIVKILSRHEVGQSKTILESIIDTKDGPECENVTAGTKIVNHITREADSRNYPICAFLGNVCSYAMQSPSVSNSKKRTLLTTCAEIVQAFWETTLAVAIEDEEKHVSNDYVCSSMLDYKCIYFSNFLPLGPEKFTRTIFVDLGMTAHQAARIVQRLCDILSFRSNAIRDLDRVNAAIDALNELNRDVNRIQMASIERSSTSGEKIKFLDEELRDILDVYSKSGRINAFITYGISGKKDSADAYFDQIIERCEDLREVRISGRAKLQDFVQRRLAEAMRRVERLHSYNSTMAARITELLDRVRTQLDSMRTERIDNTLEAQRTSVLSLAEASHSIGKSVIVMNDTLGAQSSILKSMEESSKDIRTEADRISTVLVDQAKILAEQVKLSRAAESLVLLAGVYYTYQLLDHVWINPKGDSSVLAITGTFVFAIMIAILFRFLGGKLIDGVEWVVTKIFMLWKRR